MQVYLKPIDVLNFCKDKTPPPQQDKDKITINSFLDLTSLLNYLNIKLTRNELSLIYSNYLNKTTTIPEIEKSIKIAKLITNLNSVNLVKSEKLTAITILENNQISEDNLLRIHYIMTGIYYANKSKYFNNEIIKDLFNKTLDIPTHHLKSTFKKVCSNFNFEKDTFDKLNLHLHQISLIKPSQDSFQDIGIRHLANENISFIIGQIVAFQSSLENYGYELSEKDSIEILDTIIEKKLSVSKIKNLIHSIHLKITLANIENVNLKELILTPSIEENLKTLNNIERSFKLIYNNETKLEKNECLSFMKLCLDNISKPSNNNKNIQIPQPSHFKTLKCLMELFDTICKNNQYSASSIIFAKRIIQSVSENLARLNLSLTTEITTEIINNLENKKILTNLDGLDNHITKLIIDNTKTNEQSTH